MLLVVGINALLRSEAGLILYSEIGLWTSSFLSHMVVLVDQTGSFPRGETDVY